MRGNPLLRRRTDRPDIQTGREAQVSVQHSVAVALLDGKVGVQDYSDARVRDPAVAALRRLITVQDDPDIAPQGAAIEIYTKDGKRRSTMIEFARGSAQRPMSDADLETKLSAQAEPHIGLEKARRLIESVWQLDRTDDAARLLALTVGGPA